MPFLDNDVVDFAMRLPVRSKLRALDAVDRLDENAPGHKNDVYYARTNDGKIILRKMLARLLPASYLEGAKQGFSAPDATWFRGDSIDYVKALILIPRRGSMSSCGRTPSASWWANTFGARKIAGYLSGR